MANVGNMSYTQPTWQIITVETITDDVMVVCVMKYCRWLINFKKPCDEELLIYFAWP